MSTRTKIPDTEKQEKDESATSLRTREVLDDKEKKRLQLIKAGQGKGLRVDDGSKTYDSDIHPYWIIECMVDGSNIPRAAVKMQVSVSTIYRWAKEHSEFAEGLALAEGVARAWWEEQGRRNLILGHGSKFNYGVWQLTMINRFGYRSAKSEVKSKSESKTTHEFNVKHKVDLSKLNRNEAEQLRALLARSVEGRELDAESESDGQASSGIIPHPLH